MLSKAARCHLVSDLDRSTDLPRRFLSGVRLVAQLKDVLVVGVIPGCDPDDVVCEDYPERAKVGLRQCAWFTRRDEMTGQYGDYLVVTKDLQNWQHEFSR